MYLILVTLLLVGFVAVHVSARYNLTRNTLVATYIKLASVLFNPPSWKGFGILRLKRVVKKAKIRIKPANIQHLGNIANSSE